MKWFSKLSEDKYTVYIRWFSLFTQVAILVLAIVLVVNITTKQYNSAQVDTVRLEILEQLQKDRKETDERITFLKDEILSYQSTREGRAQLFAQRVDDNKRHSDIAFDRLNKRVDNLNTKLNYWTGKVKKAEIEEKLKNQ